MLSLPCPALRLGTSGTSLQFWPHHSLEAGMLPGWGEAPYESGEGHMKMETCVTHYFAHVLIPEFWEERIEDIQNSIDFLTKTGSMGPVWGRFEGPLPCWQPKETPIHTGASKGQIGDSRRGRAGRALAQCPQLLNGAGWNKLKQLEACYEIQWNSLY